MGRQSNRQPIKAAGRFAHEAAAYSPIDGCVYLTEDNFAFPSGFYRYVPPVDPMRAGHLADGGRLQMLRVVGQPNAHLEAGQVVGASYRVDWVDIDDPSPTFPYTPGQPAPDDEQRRHRPTSATRAGPRAPPTSRASRGPPSPRHEVYFTSTQGGGAAETGPELIAGYGNGAGPGVVVRPAALAG